MSVFDEIDALHRRYRQQLYDTRARVKELGGARLRLEPEGNWTCSYRVGWVKVYLCARTPEALVAKLEAAVGHVARPAAEMEPGK